MAASADPAPEAASTNGSSSSTAPASEEVVKAYDSPESLKALADVLRSKVKIRHGVLREARIEYFKGKAARVWKVDSTLSLPGWRGARW